MGFYLRKSVKVGPLRFNISGAGIGVSAGVRGARVGTGPRGNYVHLGRNGLYYRATQARPAAPAVPSPAPLPTLAADGLEEIESASVTQMTDSSSEDLLVEIREKQGRWRLFPFGLVGGAVGLLGLFIAADGAHLALLQRHFPGWMLPFPFAVWGIACVGVAIACWWLARRDTLRKTVVLLYNFDADMERAYEAFHSGFDSLASAARVWHLQASGRTGNWKHNAGATTLVRRQSIVLRKQAAPPYVATNIAIPSIPVGRQTLYFLPDRVLVYESSRVGAVSYEQVSAATSTTRFIETEHVPRDGVQVGTTWKYVNKKGGPDKRFKDNRQLPIMAYGELHLTSPTGLNELVQVSRAEAPREFAAAVAALAATLAGSRDSSDAATSS
jgi:Protein of unknown function (DUF4236)